MRYHVFQGAGYYPQAGLGDYKRSFNEMLYAVDYFDEIKDEHDWTLIIVDDGSSLHESRYYNRDLGVG